MVFILRLTSAEFYLWPHNDRKQISVLVIFIKCYFNFKLGHQHMTSTSLPAVGVLTYCEYTDTQSGSSGRERSDCVTEAASHSSAGIGLFWQRKKWLCDWSSIALFRWDRALLAEKEVTVWLKQHRTLPLGSGSSGNWTLEKWCWCLDWCCCCKLLHVSLSHTTLMLLMNLSNIQKVSLQWCSNIVFFLSV